MKYILIFPLLIFSLSSCEQLKSYTAEGTPSEPILEAGFSYEEDDDSEKQILLPLYPESPMYIFANTDVWHKLSGKKMLLVGFIDEQSFAKKAFSIVGKKIFYEDGDEQRIFLKALINKNKLDFGWPVAYPFYLFDEFSSETPSAPGNYLLGVCKYYDPKTRELQYSFENLFELVTAENNIIKEVELTLVTENNLDSLNVL
jgi:hypothetical protein